MKRPRRGGRAAGGGSGLRLADAWGSILSGPFSPSGSAAAEANGGSTRAHAREAAAAQRPVNPDGPDPLADPDDLALERDVQVTGPRSSGPGPGRGARAWLELYQAEVAPLAAALVVVGASAWANLLAPWAWPLVGLGVLVVTAAWARWRPRRAWSLAYGLVVGVSAAVMIASGVRAGVERPAWLSLLAILTVALGLPWWIVQWPRTQALARRRPAATTSTTEEAEPEPAAQAVEARGWWAAAREVLAGRMATRTPDDEGAGIAERVQRIVDGWRELADAIGLKGAVLQAAEHDEHGFTLRLRLPAGLIPAKVADRLRELDGAFRVRPGATRVEPNRDRADLVVVRVNITNPLDPPSPWPGPSGRRPADPITLGLFETGRRIRVPIINAHWMLGGASGSGKSVTQRAVLAELVTRPYVVTMGVDVAKAGVQFAPYGPALDWLATEPGEAVRMLRGLLAMQRARARWMAAEGLTEWPVSPEHPQVVVVVDEVSDLSTIPGVPELIEALSKVAREQGITLILATQRASADALGDSAVARAQMNVRLALRCTEKGDGDLILGRGRAAEGWRPDRLTLSGSMLVLTEAETTPCPGRSWFMRPEDARRVAAEAAQTRTQLDDVSAEAVAPFRAPSDGEDDAGELPGDVATGAGLGVPTRRVRLTAAARVLALVEGLGADGAPAGDIVASLEGVVSRTQTFAALKSLLEAGKLAQREDGRYVRVVAGENDDLS